MFKITTIPGDGIGQEVMKPTLEILETTNANFDFIPQEAGKECYKKYGTNLPQETINSCKESDSTLFGAVTSIPQQKSAIVTLRKELNLYINQRPIKSYTNPEINFTIIRENSEGLYSHMEEDNGEETIAIRKITHKASERICDYAFRYAEKIGKKTVTAAHKANVLPITDGVFKTAFYKIANQYPNIIPNDYYIDAMAMYLITKPSQFDVIVTTNLFGDILSDEGGGLLGSLGLIPSANIGNDNGLFEPVHGSAPDIAGKNKANPIAMILSSCLMLEFLNMEKEAQNIQNTIEEIIREGKIKTPDMGGTQNTQEMCDEIIKKL
ncbi:isocitrate/isopropylmalate dehydrogenase family protein [Methanosphaera sp. ISO3-F5]|uniref:isocitrate/isopropylmalate dehydrogenase family protein n=1 Tax=Methanosphaera sp. ISO3-F5 TaxID=1452353 RepID=UPI002B2635BC|nr:isocitrate/isopropylmalate dehydrogenase family protein [Methanosphaera sp. ISO3-F5]WQH63283.1 isocitrate/isopropylmalate dehydrogenase family protein [Methanosphaera sp. ISO3-F5]